MFSVLVPNARTIIPQMTIAPWSNGITMMKQVAYATLGVALGIVVSLFSSWAGAPSLESQEILPAKMTVRAVAVNLQSTILSIAVIVGLALICAFAVGVVTKKKLT